MTVAPPLSPPASVAPERRTDRDGAVDLVRALCVVAVVVLHALMVGVTVSGGAPVFVNASDGTAWVAPLSWVLQVMPLFFVIGGFSGAVALRRFPRRDAAAFAAARLRRLLLPAAVTIATVGALLALLLAAGVPAGIVAIAGFRYGQPLWFLGVFLLCQALLPWMLARHERMPVRTIALLVLAAVGVDVVRAATGIPALGFLNLAFVWLALQQLGFFLADGRIDRLTTRTRAVIAGGAALTLAGGILTGAFSPDLIANLNPPTTALLLVGLAHTALFSLLRTPIARVATTRPGRALTRFVTPRTMTVYLWHMPVLLLLAGLTALAALATGIAPPVPDSIAWWMTRPLWLAVALVTTAAVAVPLARVEAHRPAPSGPVGGGRVATAVVTGIAAVVLLLTTGTSPLTAAVAVVLIAVALRLARSPQARAAGIVDGIQEPVPSKP